MTRGHSMPVLKSSSRPQRSEWSILLPNTRLMCGVNTPWNLVTRIRAAACSIGDAYDVQPQRMSATDMPQGRAHLCERPDSLHYRTYCP
jgi:hypothetical protein